MLFKDMIRRTIELLAEEERTAMLKQRLKRQRYRKIPNHNEIAPGVPMSASLITITDNRLETNVPANNPTLEPRSDLSDLLQRLSVLTAVHKRCAAMASETVELP